MPSPEARIAIISLSEAMRLKPSSTPTSTDMGIVYFSRFGSVKRNISNTSESVELLRTTTSRMRGRLGMNRINVKSAHPMKV